MEDGIVPNYLNILREWKGLVNITQTRNPFHDQTSFYTYGYGENDYEIILGKYEDLECELASFFHELGHCVCDQLNPIRGNQYARELRAWQVGFALANQLGIKFRRKTINWCETCLETYEDRITPPEVTK